MRRIMASLALGAVLASTGSAEAQRAQTPAMTCGQVQALVARAGAIVLGTGGYTYDRYVYHRGFCQPTETLKLRYVPTRDTPYCVLYTCIEPNGDHWRWR